MSPVPAAALAAAAGVMAAAAVRHVERADVHHRIAPVVVGEPRRRPRLAVPGIGWPWWPVAGAVVGYVVGGVVAALIGLVIVRVGAIACRRREDGKRKAVLDDQLADAVRSLAAGMRAGLSVPQAIAFVAREGEPPLATTFAQVVDHVDLGGDLTGALDDWAAEVGTDDAELVVGVLALHRRTGGDLPRVLDEVAVTLRDRSAVAREVRALTAQARLSGAILGLLPIAFFMFLWMTSRGDVEGAFASPVGVTAIVVGLTLEGLAFLWIRSLLAVN